MKLKSAVAAMLFIVHSGGAAQAECGPDALGTERTITLPRQFAEYGGQNKGLLPLKPGEVVLTFDDGPRPQTTPSVLDALAEECTRATFLAVGQNLRDNPALAKRTLAEGHSIGIHSFTHPHMSQLSPAQQIDDLKKTILAYGAIFGKAPAAYRFPFLEETPTLMAAMKAANMTVLSVDVGIDDWQPGDTTEILRERLMNRLKASGGGIILMHDANGPTADAMPALLKALKTGGYKVVHIVWAN